MEVIKAGHSVYRRQYHVIWVCKYRRKILNAGVVEFIGKILVKLLKSMPGVKIEKIGFDEDHVHFVMIIPNFHLKTDLVGRRELFCVFFVVATFCCISVD